MSFKVFFINHGYGPDQEFATIPDAVEAGKRAHFEFTVSDDQGVLHVGWGPISGTRTYTEVARQALQLVADGGIDVTAGVEPEGGDWRTCPICSALFADGGIVVVAESDGEVIGQTTVNSGEQAANWIVAKHEGKP